MTGHERIRAYGGAAGLAVVGGICGFLVHGLVGQIIRLTLITLAVGAVVMLVFYEIGLSEDKARELEEEERRRNQPEHDEPSRRLWSPPPRRPS